MQSEKLGTDYRGKNMEILAGPSVTVSFEKMGGKKGKKGGGAKFNQT